MRATIGSIAVLVLAGWAGSAGAADEKVDAKKLIGKWEPAVPEKDGPKMVLDIADKGKLTLRVTTNGKTIDVEGTYKVDGNKFEVELTFNGKTMKDTLTIVKLTDTDLVTKGNGEKEETLKRIKDK
jgi:uncharacterized protein (TIGR03066 family)